uniref:Uncharacterized protein n=1 Tax=Arundo donax TaxID=35708 RepID=A0A0A9A5D2_ARUDO
MGVTTVRASATMHWMLSPMTIMVENYSALDEKSTLMQMGCSSRHLCLWIP